MGTFILSKKITDNIYKQEQQKIIKELGFSKEFLEDGRDFNYFLSDYVNNGLIDKNEVKKHLFNALFYGQQRECYIYKIAKFEKSILLQENLITRLNTYNKAIDSLAFNDIVVGSLNTDENDLVAIKAFYKPNTKSIAKVRMLFANDLDVMNHKKEVYNAITYIAVEINLLNNTLMIRVASRSNVSILDDKKQPDYLNYIYKEKICSLFKLTLSDFGNTHKETICNMSKELYNQIYSEMVKTKPHQLDEFVTKTEKEFNSIIGIKDIELKKSINNVFNISDNFEKMIEHILISDILYEVEKGRDLENVDGLVTYLRFTDGKKISARLKGASCREPIFDSEAFMALRSAIENSQRILRLEVCWLGDYDKLRVTYDASSSEYLNVHFYKNLEKDELDYALGQFRNYEAKTIRFVAVEAKA